MHFTELPVKVPVSVNTLSGVTVEGHKLIVLGNTALETSGRVFLYVPGEHALKQVCPFHPDITLPLTGWRIVQIEMFHTVSYSAHPK